MGSKILLVDDEETIRFAFSALLSSDGYEVTTADSYAAALNTLSGNEFDLIITDILLGDHTGVDLLRQVKDKGLSCPVIMITGEPNIKTATEAVRLGAFDYIPKPIRKEKLYHVTRLALNHKALLDEKSRLQLENERYRQDLEAIFKSLQDAVITVDHNLMVIKANKAAKQICGTRPEAMTNKVFGETQKHCTKACIKVLEKTLKTHQTMKEVCVECVHDEKPQQIVLITCSALKSQENKFIGAVLVARDITRLTDLERKLEQKQYFHNIIGGSRKMQQIYSMLHDLSDTDTTVLISGESGTGKELVARALHYEGNRTLEPLITVNCSALSENLLESELFGHVKGAFTGAIKNKTGRFELADKGTIFLDEIGDISPVIQLKLLRVLQERVFERVGEPNPITVDVRIIAATNRNLKNRVMTGEFREDLYYRLKVVEIIIPPLSERREDIPLLVDHFCAEFSKSFNRNIRNISDDVLNIFMSYLWPGNIRELKHVIEHAFVVCRNHIITTDHLPPEIMSHSNPVDEDIKETHSIGNPGEILDALNKTGWNKAKAARLLGVSRQTIYRKINEFKIVEP